MSVRGYELLADWSRHGTYVNVLEDVTSYILDEPDVFVSYGRDQSRATSAATAGKLTFALNNLDRAFSPENTSSAIAGKVVPGTPVRLLQTHESATTTIFAGVLDELNVDPNAAAKTFTGDVLDLWGRLGAEVLSTPLYSGLRTGEAIGLILDAIGWTGDRDLDPGATFMPWWWEEGTDAATAVDKLVESEGPPAIAYVQGGTFIFRDRHHRTSRAASLTSQGTYTHAVPAGSGPVGSFKVLRNSFAYDHGLRHIVNSVTFIVDERLPGDVEEIWSTDTPITLAAGQVLPIEVEANNPFLNAVPPEVGVDWDADVAITVDLSRTSGQSTTLTVTATGGAAVITRLALRAVSVPVVRTVKVDEEDVSSIGMHTRQTWPKDRLPWANVYDARAVAERIVAVYATNRPTVTLSIANLDDDYMTQILARRISDRVTVINDEMGLDADFIVERITHTIRKLGGIHRLELGCQVADPVQPSNIFTFDVAGKGFNDGAFGVDGIDDPDTTLMFDIAGRGFNDGVFAS